MYVNPLGNSIICTLMDNGVFLGRQRFSSFREYREGFAFERHKKCCERDWESDDDAVLHLWQTW